MVKTVQWYNGATVQWYNSAMVQWLFIDDRTQASDSGQHEEPPL
jgi:hypothetical protein